MVEKALFSSQYLARADWTLSTLYASAYVGVLQVLLAGLTQLKICLRLRYLAAAFNLCIFTIESFKNLAGFCMRDSEIERSMSHSLI
jgi:hypothetical protein